MRNNKYEPYIKKVWALIKPTFSPEEKLYCFHQLGITDTFIMNGLKKKEKEGISLDEQIVLLRKKVNKSRREHGYRVVRCNVKKVAKFKS